MGYSGYYQFICKTGHLYSVDAMELYYGDEEAEFCPVCSASPVWQNSIDQTNNDPPPFSKFRVKEPAVTKTCHECGHTKQVSEVTYHVPTEREMTEYNNEVEEYYRNLYDG